MDEAAELVTRTIDAASHDQPLPEVFPKNIIPFFNDYGKTLHKDEQFEVRLPGKKLKSHYSIKERDYLSKMVSAEYEDELDLVGEIRLADLDGGNFGMRLADGAKITGKFSPDQEAIVVDALREHLTRRLRFKGRAEFVPEGKMKRIVSLTNVSLEAVQELSWQEDRKPIWEIVQEISASVPDEEWEKLPADLSKNLDHYLYGKPKSGE